MNLLQGPKENMKCWTHTNRSRDFTYFKLHGGGEKSLQTSKLQCLMKATGPLRPPINPQLLPQHLCVLCVQYPCARILHAMFAAWLIEY